MKYKAVVFDYGGVIACNPAFNKESLFSRIAQLLGITEAELRAEYFKHNHLANVENTPWSEVFALVAATFTRDAVVIQNIIALVTEFHAGDVVNEELLNYAEKLEQAGYVIAILSNYTSELRSVITKNGVADHFEHVFVSTEIGYQKPDPKAFAVVCEALQIEPIEMIFIDDSLKSLSTADEVGYTPIHYTNNQELFAKFEELGVEV